MRVAVSVLMDTPEGRRIWQVSPPGPEDVIAIDDNVSFVAVAIPRMILRWPSAQRGSGRVFCYTDPDQAIADVSRLDGDSIPRLVLVDMVFGVHLRGLDIIRTIRRHSWRTAIVGYSAQTGGPETPQISDSVLGGAAASEVGADEWLNTTDLIKADFETDFAVFHNTLERALERRQFLAKRFDEEVLRLNAQSVEWALTLLDALDQGESASILKARIAHFVTETMSRAIGEPSWEIDLNQFRASLGRRASTPRLTSWIAEPPSAEPPEMLAAWNILAAQSLNADPFSGAAVGDAKIRQFHEGLDTLSQRFGLRATLDRIYRTISSAGRNGLFAQARSLSALCRDWVVSARDTDHSDRDRALLLGSEAYLKATQGQAAAELGFSYEALDYLTAAAADAELYDIPSVARIARNGLDHLSATRLNAPA